MIGCPHNAQWWLVAGWLKKKQNSHLKRGRTGDIQQILQSLWAVIEGTPPGMVNVLDEIPSLLLNSIVCSFFAPWLNLLDPPFFLLCFLAVSQTDNEEYSPLRGWTALLIHLLLWMLGNPKIISGSLEYFPGGQVVKIPLPLRRAWGWSPPLVRETLHATWYGQKERQRLE